MRCVPGVSLNRHPGYRLRTLQVREGKAQLRPGKLSPGKLSPGKLDRHPGSCLARAVMLSANGVLLAAVATEPAGANSSLLHHFWSAFNDLIAFTANVWQNIDGLVFTGVAVYLLIRLAKSVLGHDESTIKTSTSFDYLGAFPRESDHKVFLLEDVWKLPFHEKTVRACFRQANEEQPFLCIPNRSVWLSLHDFYSGMRNDSVPRASDLRRDHTLHRVSHILGITFGNYEIQQARIEDLAAPKLLDILRDPVREFQKAALSSRELETARQLALLELAALVCWKAPHLVADALMEPESNQAALLKAPGGSAIEKKNNLESQLKEQHKAEYERLLEQGINLGRLMLLNRSRSYEWLSALQLGTAGEKSNDGAPVDTEERGSRIPRLSKEEHAAVSHSFKQRERFQPWTHRLVETISALPYVQRRFPYQEYVTKVGRLEADGWLVRVYVNHETGD